MEPPPVDQIYGVRVGDKDYPYAVNDTTTAGSISELIRTRLRLQNGALVKLNGVGLADDTRLQAGTTYVFADSSPRGNHKIPIIILRLICNKTPIIEQHLCMPIHCSVFHHLFLPNSKLSSIDFFFANNSHISPIRITLI